MKRNMVYRFQKVYSGQRFLIPIMVNYTFGMVVNKVTVFEMNILCTTRLKERE